MDADTRTHQVWCLFPKVNGLFKIKRLSVRIENMKIKSTKLDTNDLMRDLLPCL